MTLYLVILKGKKGDTHRDTFYAEGWEDALTYFTKNWRRLFRLTSLIDYRISLVASYNEEETA